METNYQSLLDAIPTNTDYVISPETVGDDSLKAHDYFEIPRTEVIVPTLTAFDRSEAHRCMLRAGYIGVKNQPAVHYTEGPLRWSWHAPLKRSIWGQYPSYADCSSFVTWCGEDALMWLNIGDIFNGLGYTAGYTGTLVQHGSRISTPVPGDFVFYGDLTIPYHVAMYIGGGRVISHGREIGPEIVPIGPATQVRRYI